MTNSIQVQTIGSIRQECENGLNPTTKGSFMRFADVLRYFEDNQLIENLDYFLVIFGASTVEIEGVNYISSNAIKQYMSTSEVRTMECQVTTLIFGIVEQDVWLDQDFLG